MRGIPGGVGGALRMNGGAYGRETKDALAEARAKARDARRAFSAFEGATQEDVDAIVRAMAAGGTAAAEELARLAVDETGYGIYEDKIVKNKYNTIFVAASILPMRTIGVLWVDEHNRMTALGSPMGVIAGIIPVTNPTSTVLFKCLAAVKSGNAIVCAPHPRAARCSARAAEVMAEAESLEYSGKGRNIFSMFSTPVQIEAPKAPPRPQTMVPVVTGPPPPPPIELKFFGYESRQGAKKVFLLHGDDVFIAAEGDVVDHHYKVVKIAPLSVQVEDIPYHNTQTLPLVQN